MRRQGPVQRPLTSGCTRSAQTMDPLDGLLIGGHVNARTSIVH
jgi:hypothetical protein